MADQNFRVKNGINVGTGVTITTSEYQVGTTRIQGNGIVAGVITATSFVGDGSGLTNAGSTLSGASGTQRIVLTSLTSGTMTNAATNSDLTYNSSTQTLGVTNISIGGTLTYEDVTNVDSLGIITARSGVRVTAGGLQVTAGVSTFGGAVELDSTLKDIWNNVGTGSSVLISTGIGVSWIPIATAALQGVQGIQGAQGIQGVQGAQGTQGIQGIQGAQGFNGTIGTQGIQGVQGAQGFNGTLGSQGVQGAQGSNFNRTEYSYTATAGQTTFAATYSDGTDIDVFLNGVRLNPADYTATSGTNVVLSVGASAGNIIDILVFQSAGPQGTTGTQGTVGPQGVQGPQGIQGVQGFSFSRVNNNFTATSNQTTFSVTYTVGNIDVYVNGAHLTGSEYTATNGTSVVLNDPLVAGDIVDIITFTSAGPQGTQGAFGTQGTNGAQGTTGAQGTQGTQAAQGTTGTQGATGIQGATGSQGITGSQGSTGTQGATGIQGATGSQGTTGTQGIQGIAGPSTTINATDDSSTTTLYPVMVAGTGSNQTAKGASTRNFVFNASSGFLGLGVAPLAPVHTYSTTNNTGLYTELNVANNKQGIYITGSSTVGSFIAGNLKPDLTALQSDFGGRIVLQGSSASTDGMKFQISTTTAGNTASYAEYLRIRNDGNIQLINSGTKIIDSNGDPVLNQSGSILQVVTARNGDYYSSSSTSWTDITGLSLNITPSSTSSKIFLQLSLGRATTSLNNLDYICVLRILANGSDSLYINGNTSGSRLKGCMNVNGLAYNADHSPGGWTCSALESPGTTSTITYKAQVTCQSGSYPFIMNGTPNNSDSAATYHYRAQSSLTAWEVAG